MLTLENVPYTHVLYVGFVWEENNVAHSSHSADRSKIIWEPLLKKASVCDWILSLPEAGGFLPTATADEDQTLPADWTWFSLSVCGHLEHG